LTSTRPGFLMGVDASPIGMLHGVLLTLLIGGACAAASNALALTTKSEDVMAPVINMVMMPHVPQGEERLTSTPGTPRLPRQPDP
jgi:ABC-2 type transport system permease protein